MNKKFILKTMVVALLAIGLSSFASYAAEEASQVEETKEQKIERLNKEIDETVLLGPAMQIEINEKRAELEALTADTTVVEAVAVVEEPVALEAVPEEVAVVEEAQPVAAASGNRWGISLTDEEFNITARIGQLECGGESDEGQQAVFEVIFNRVASPDWPNNTVDVLSQKIGKYRQFTTWKNVNSSRANPSEKIKKNLRIVLDGGSNILPMNTVYFSTSPQNKRIQKHIGRHYFCNR